MPQSIPQITIPQTRGKENTSFPFLFQVKRSGAYKRASLLISVQGIPNDWHCDIRQIEMDQVVKQATYDPVSGNITIQIHENCDFDNAVHLTPPLHSDFDIDNGLVTVFETDMETEQRYEAQAEFTVIVDAVASPPVLDVMNVKGIVGTDIPLPIYAAVVDFDGSEEITSVIFQDVPAGAKMVKAADLGAGRWSVLHKNLEDLYINVPEAGIYELTVTATVQEVNTHGAELDEEDNVAVTEKVFTLTVTG